MRNIGKHRDIIRRSLHALSTKYENIVLLGDFNVWVDDDTLETICKFYSLHSLTKPSACFKNLENHSCTNLILTNKPSSFQSRSVIGSGLSGFHRMMISDLKVHSRKLAPKGINIEIFKKIDSLHYTPDWRRQKSW